MYPLADIPIFQISLIKGFKPKDHIELGKTLSMLKDDNIMIIGYGFSFHNMSEFMFNGDNIKDSKNDDFQDWLIDVCVNEDSFQTSYDKLISWENAPNARYCHPREEHLLPLHICYGASQSKVIKIFDDGIIRGLIFHGNSRDEINPDLYELYAIYMEPLFKYKGIGKQFPR